jgi:dipeptidyl aminopeptidase/acylaminoacyl peptidase
MKSEPLARPRWPIFALAVFLSAACTAPAAELSPFQVEDLYRFDGPQGLVVDSGQSRAIYVRQWIDPQSRQERNSLWLVDEGLAPRAMERGEPDARSPVFSPDGQWIAFRSTRRHPITHNQIPAVPVASDPATDIWLIRSDGTQPLPLSGSEKPYGRVFNDTFYGGVAFSPDGRRLAFVADGGGDGRSAEEVSAGVDVVRPDQGEGYTGYGAAQLWIADLDYQAQKHAAVRIERLTNDDVWYGDPQWSSDGRSLFVHANRTADRESVRYSINKDYNLWRIDAETGGIEQLTFAPGPEVSPRLSPDGKRLACLSGPRKGPHADVLNLAVVQLGQQPTLNIVFNAHDDADGKRDPAPAYPLPDRCWEGEEAIVYSAAQGTRTATMRHDLATGKRSALQVTSDEPLEGLTPLVRDAVLKRRLTPASNAFLKQRLRGQTRVVEWKSRDERTIEGVLTVPHESIAAAPYKLIVMPHGGPHSRSSEGFNFTAEVFAAQGYAVFQPNFRGSAGYGRKFLDADRNDLGGGDMQDILTGIESLVRDKIADPQRQFVYGVSYGGYMTAWLVGQTTQFRAAAAQNAVTDLTMMWSLSDLQSWTEWEFGGRPWEVPEAMRKHSPLTYVAHVKTPTLILHSRDDRRCPLPMGRAFHQALVARGVPTQMVVYPDEGHGIKQPRHREDVLKRVLAWFAEHDRDE